MLRVKFGYRFPVPHDVKKLSVSYVKRTNAVKLESVTEEINVVRTLDGTRFNVETERAIEFECVASLDKDIPRDGLVLEFLMFEGAGTTLHDTSRVDSPNNGTLYGPTWQQLETGKWVLDFDGVDDYVAYPILWNLPTEVTMLAWVRADVLDKRGSIIYHGEGGEIQLIADIGGYRILAKFADKIWRKSPIVPAETGEFYLVAGTFVKGDSLKIYLNGEFKGSTSIPDLDLWSPSGYLPSIGAHSRRRITGNEFDGLIGLAAVYTRALSEDEINEIYDQTRVYFGV